MARLNILAFVAILVAGCSSLNVPTADVVCSEHGFSPVFVQMYDEGKKVEFEVKVGDAGPGCMKKKMILGEGETTTISGKDLSGRDELPYKVNGKPVCGGTFAYNINDQTTIDYTVGVNVIVTETLRKVVKRSLRYEFVLSCHLTRAVSQVSGQTGWDHVSTLKPVGPAQTVSESFTVATTLKFYEAGYQIERAGEFELNNADDLFIRVAEEKSNPLFKFVVNKCWSTPGPNPNHDIKDIFFDKKCPVDETVRINGASTNHFDVQMKSFFFVAEPDKAVHVHCSIFICQVEDNVDDECVQLTQEQCVPGGVTRKRRSVNRYEIKEETITAKQHMIIRNNDIFPPTCANGYVFDRVHKECGNRNVLQVKGISLNMPWHYRYANSSSAEFKRMAQRKSYQLYTLVTSSSSRQDILGVKVVRAYYNHGTHIDAQVIYSQDSNVAMAASEFEYAVRATNNGITRVVNLLNVKREAVIEYVPIALNPSGGLESGSLMQICLIVMGVMLLIAVFYGLLTYSKNQSGPYTTMFVPKR